MIVTHIVLPALGVVLVAFLFIVCWSIVRKSSKDPYNIEELDCVQRFSKEKLQAINKTWEEYYNLSLQGKTLTHLGSNGTSSLLTISFLSVERSSQVTFQEEPHIITVE